MSGTTLPDVSAELSTADGKPCVAVKIGSPTFELNVWIPEAQAALLQEVRDARWDSRSSVQLGDVAGASAWWSVDPEMQTLAIVIGHDDETWDVGAWWPLATLDRIIAEVQNCLSPNATEQ